MSSRVSARRLKASGTAKDAAATVSAGGIGSITGPPSTRNSPIATPASTASTNASGVNAASCGSSSSMGSDQLEFPITSSIRSWGGPAIPADTPP